MIEALVDPDRNAATEPLIFILVLVIVAATLPDIGNIPPAMELTTVTLPFMKAATEPDTF